MVVSTVESLGKSLMPWSSMEMELSRSCSDDFKEETDAASDCALDEEFMIIVVVKYEVVQSVVVALWDGKVES